MVAVVWKFGNNQLLNCLNISGVGGSFSLFDIEVYSLSFMKPIVVVRSHDTIMKIDDTSLIIFNKSIAVLIIEPFYCSLIHPHHLPEMDVTIRFISSQSLT